MNSRNGGRSGAKNARSDVDTPRARSLPDWTCGHELVAASIAASTCPPIRSVTIGAEPLYGTWTIFVPVFCMKSSIAMCNDEPDPDEPNDTFAGFAFR